VKLVVGLGNPGRRYVESRHNVGFIVVDELARRWALGAGRFEKRFEALAWEAARGDERVLLLQPQTFMNLSGRSVSAARRFYKIELADILVVFDDLDLPVGRLRLRGRGSAGGHKGLADILRHLGDDAVPRLRFGIGKVDASVTVQYVLGKFRPDEQPAVAAAVVMAADAVECWLAQGLETAMNEYNRKEERKS
jgi:PTH1 family peptidyl-tRNA hydrolase